MRNVQQLEVKVEAGSISHFLLEVRTFGQRRIQRDLLPCPLDDEGAGFLVGHVVVAAFTNRDAFVELLRPKANLSRRANIALPLELDAETLASGAFPAVAPHQITRPNRLSRP